MPLDIPLKQVDLGENVLTVDTDGNAEYDTITAALAVAAGGDKIYIAPGTYIETVTCVSGVDLYGPGAVVDGQVVLADDCKVKLHKVMRSTAGTTVTKSSGTGTSWVDIDEIDVSSGAANGIANFSTSGVVIADVRTIRVGTGTGVGDSGGIVGPMQVTVGDILLGGNGSYGVAKSLGNEDILGRVGRIIETGTPTTTTALYIGDTGGSIDLFANIIDADTAWNIGNSSILKLMALNVSGTKTAGAAATVNTALPPDGFYPSAGEAAIVHPTDDRADFNTIQAAIDDTVSDNIFIAPATYSEELTVGGATSCQCLIGLGTPWGTSGAGPRITPNITTADGVALLIQKQFEIRNLEIIPATSGSSTNSISAVKCTGGPVVIRNCDIKTAAGLGATGTYYRGLWISGAFVRVYDSTIAAGYFGGSGARRAVYHDGGFRADFFNTDTTEVPSSSDGTVEINNAAGEIAWHSGVVQGAFTVTSANEWWVGPGAVILGTRTTTGDPAYSGTLPNGTTWYDTSTNKLRGRENGASVNLRTGWPFGKVHTVDPSDSDADYSTIGAAITAASAGDTILIGPGDYAEQLTLSKSLRLVGHGREADIGDGTSSRTRIRPTIGDTQSAVTANAGGTEVVFEDLEVSPLVNNQNESGSSQAVNIQAAVTFVFRNCAIQPEETGSSSTSNDIWGINASAGNVILDNTLVKVLDPSGQLTSAIVQAINFTSSGDLILRNGSRLEEEDATVEGRLTVNNAAADVFLEDCYIEENLVITSANSVKFTGSVRVDGTITDSGNKIANDTEAGALRTSASVRLDMGAVSDGQFLQRSGTSIVGASGGGGDSIQVGGVAVTDANFNDSTPAAPTGGANVKWQRSGTGPDSVSAYVPQASALFIDTTGNQTLNGTAATVNLDSNPVTDGNYSLATDEVTVNSDGRYEITFHIGFNITNTSGGARGTVLGWIEDDNSGTYAVTPGSYGRTYTREATAGSGITGGTIVDLVDTDKIRLRMQRINGTTNMDTEANQVSLTIKKIG